MTFFGCEGGERNTTFLGGREQHYLLETGGGGGERNSVFATKRAVQLLVSCWCGGVWRVRRRGGGMERVTRARHGATKGAEACGG
eukprot:358072-Chlamydomonas_euryale.AAC.1